MSTDRGLGQTTSGGGNGSRAASVKPSAHINGPQATRSHGRQPIDGPSVNDTVDDAITEIFALLVRNLLSMETHREELLQLRRKLVNKHTLDIGKKPKRIRLCSIITIMRGLFSKPFVALYGWLRMIHDPYDVGQNTVLKSQILTKLSQKDDIWNIILLLIVCTFHWVLVNTYTTYQAILLKLQAVKDEAEILEKTKGMTVKWKALMPTRPITTIITAFSYSIQSLYRGSIEYVCHILPLSDIELQAHNHDTMRSSLQGEGLRAESVFVALGLTSQLQSQGDCWSSGAHEAALWQETGANEQWLNVDETWMRRHLPDLSLHISTFLTTPSHPIQLGLGLSIQGHRDASNSAITSSNVSQQLLDILEGRTECEPDEMLNLVDVHKFLTPEQEYVAEVEERISEFLTVPHGCPDLATHLTGLSDNTLWSLSSAPPSASARLFQDGVAWKA
ncbi:hypothetical protein M422DRAFT_51646 [Sphaerobolus stellatus SS14]|uniref:Uncharacterized protein n=1 Tax=Sphaerobolus stellatus (strain SS14) TaxID=990650 RepID=A0A0C9UJV3_SPHS4|nr:hypothetical protein M422DRAFT_51646 [Sphaerobolus stellatus SS14]